MSVFSRYNIVIQLPSRNPGSILWNPISGAMDAVPDHIGEIVRREDLPALAHKPKLKEYLTLRGYVFPDKNSEEAAIAEMYQVYLNVMAKKAMSFIIIPTYKCNFGCPYCFETDFLKDTSQVISEKVINAAFDVMNFLSNEKLFAEKALALFGGEPLLDDDEVRDAVEMILIKARENHFAHIKVVTNGATLHEYIDMLEYYQVDTIQLTIDGPKEVHDSRRYFKNTHAGSFDLIMENVELSLSKGFTTHLRVNLDKENIDRFPELIDYMLKRRLFKYDNLHLAPAVVGDFGNKGTYGSVASVGYILKKVLEFSRIYDWPNNALNLEAWPGLKYIQYVLKNRRPYIPLFSHCDSNVHTYAFDPFGDIYTCPDIIGRKEFSVGTFYPKFLIKGEELRKWRLRNIFTLSQCTYCNYALICGGGCTLEAVNTCKDILSPACRKKDLKNILQTAFDYYYEALFRSNSEGGTNSEKEA